MASIRSPTSLEAIAGGIAMVVWLFWSAIFEDKPSFSGVMVGGVAGLATITPTAGYIEPWAAIIVGALGATICYFAKGIQEKFKYDDALEVFRAHGIGGITGSLLVGFFAGLITDIQFGTILGFYALLYLVIGFVNGLFEQLYFDEDIKLPLFLISVSEFLYGIIIYLLMFMLRSDFNFLYYLNRIIVPELIYTIVITLGLYPLILFINHKLEAEEKRSASKFV